MRGSPEPRPFEPRPFKYELIEQELDILWLLADGLSDLEIAAELHYSRDTIKHYAKRLYLKLGARGRSHAVAIGFRRGFLV